MPPLPFTRNDAPTLGVEVELQLVDAQTYKLRSAIADVLDRLPPDLEHCVKPELMQCYLEINTGVCKTVGEVRRDLQQTLRKLYAITDAIDIRLFWGATHPVSSWRRQEVTVTERYYRLVELMQDIARRLVTYGLHVHVGVESGDKAVMVCDRMLRHLPLLLALSANSPFWEGRPTGLMSNRSKIMEMLPTAGLPLPMRNWSEYTWLVNHLIDTGFINTIREIWWDIRPHHNFGTVEIRMCDLPPNLEHVLSLTALAQCLVVAISREIDEGTYQSDYHPMMVAQNKWRATRYGVDARLINAEDYQPYSVQETTDHLIDLLRPVAVELDCSAELEACSQLPKQSGAEEQLKIHAESLSRHTVVKQMLERHEWRG